MASGGAAAAPGRIGVERIDAEAKVAGFLVSPLRAHDEATLSLVLQASLTQIADRVMADRLDLQRLRSLIEALIAAGVHGRRSGDSFYLYENNRRTTLNPAVGSVLDETGAAGAPGAAGERRLLAVVTESLLCWGLRDALSSRRRRPRRGAGYRFPRRLGGPFHWVDAQRAAAVRERCEAHGAAFPVPATLRDFSTAGGAYGELVRRERPGQA